MVSMQVLGSIKEQLGAQWDIFMYKIKNAASSRMDVTRQTDGISIELSYFANVLQTQYGIQLAEL